MIRDFLTIPKENSLELWRLSAIVFHWSVTLWLCIQTRVFMIIRWPKVFNNRWLPAKITTYFTLTAGHFVLYLINMLVNCLGHRCLLWSLRFLFKKIMKPLRDQITKFKMAAARYENENPATKRIKKQQLENNCTLWLKVKQNIYYAFF